MAFERTTFSKFAATALALALAATTATSVASVASPGSVLTGTVFLGANRSPLEHATVHLSNTVDDKLVSAGPTDALGNFKLEDLPPATYEVAVEYDGGLYLVSAPVRVVAGEPLVLNLAIEKSASPATAVPQSRRGAGGVFSSPLAGTLMVAGSAIAVGAVIESSTSSDDEPPASHFLTR